MIKRENRREKVKENIDIEENDRKRKRREINCNVEGKERENRKYGKKGK